MLTYALLTYADVCCICQVLPEEELHFTALTYADVCWRMLAYAMLTDADVCCTCQVLPEEVLRFTALTTLKLSRFGMQYMTQGISRSAC
jgi:hypothetical protein